jgi:transposase
VVQAIQALRGVSLLVAAVIVAEVGCFGRFASPYTLMAYLGLNPSEHSSGATIRRGAITKTGNTLARTCLVEAAWTYRFPARVTRSSATGSQSCRNRSVTLPGKRRCGFRRATASASLPASRHPRWSWPSRANWLASSGRSLAW